MQSTQQIQETSTLFISTQTRTEYQKQNFQGRFLQKHNKSACGNGKTVKTKDNSSNLPS